MNKIKKMRYLLMLLLCSAMIGCSLPDLFNSKPDSTNKQFAGTEYPILSVLKAGGILETGQNLLVLSDGEARLENYYNIRLIRSRLLESDVLAIQNLFIDNQFFFLDEKYISGRTNEFLYTLTFYQSGTQHTIIANYSAAPANLQIIITEIEKLLARIADWSLDLKVELDKSSMTQGDTLVMRLHVQNLSNFPLTLNFKNGKIYKFQVLKRPSPEANREEVIWESEHASNTNPGGLEQTLQPGEIRIYQEYWNGRDKAGLPVLGKFLVGAELLSVPGGIPGEMPFEIRKDYLNNRAVVIYGDSLRLSIAVSDTVISPPEDVTFSMTGENISSRTIQVPVDIASFGLQVSTEFEFVNTIVWEMSKTTFLNNPDQALRRLDSGAKDQFTDTWRLNTRLIFNLLPRGIYTVQGKLYNKETGQLTIRLE